MWFPLFPLRWQNFPIPTLSPKTTRQCFLSQLFWLFILCPLSPRLANLFMPSVTPPLILILELFPSPQLIAMSVTRIGQNVKMTCLPASFTIIQYQYSVTLFPPESARSRTPTLPNLSSIDMVSPWHLYWRRVLLCPVIVTPPQLISEILPFLPLYMRPKRRHAIEVFLLFPTPVLFFALPFPLLPKMFLCFPQCFFLLLLTFPLVPPSNFWLLLCGNLSAERRTASADYVVKITVFCKWIIFFIQQQWLLVE